MQFLRPDYLASQLLRRADMAHSPFHKAIQDTEDKRSRLFPDRRRIPGRKAKLLIAVSLLLQFWGIGKVIEIKKFMKSAHLFSFCILYSSTLFE